MGPFLKALRTYAKRRRVGRAAGRTLRHQRPSPQHPATTASVFEAAGKKTAVIVDAIPLDARQFTAQYELLRSHVSGAAGDALRRDLRAPLLGVGLGLLLREGMPGWLNAIAAVIRASLAQRIMDIPLRPLAEPPAERGIESPWLSSVQREDITAALVHKSAACGMGGSLE